MSKSALYFAGFANGIMAMFFDNGWATNHSDMPTESMFIAGVILVSAGAIVGAIQSTETKP
jgi:hypothetical protein